MIQVLLGCRLTSPTTTAARAIGITQEGVSWNAASDGHTIHPWSCAGVMRNLMITLDVAVGAGNSVVFALYVNGAASALSVTLAAGETTARNTTDEVAIAVGDKVAILLDPVLNSSCQTPQISLEFEGTTDNESGYGFAGSYVNTTAARYAGVFFSDAWSATAGANANVVPTAGTVTRWDVLLSGSAGAVGKGFTFTIFLNGVAQDGTGGTPNTTISLLGAVASGSSTFTLALVAGDIVEVVCAPVGAAPNLVGAAFSVAFTAADTGVSVLCGGTTNVLHTTSTEYRHLASRYGDTWSGTRAPILGGVSTVTIGDFRVVLSAAPGAGGSGDTYTLACRKNASVDASDPSVAIAETATTGADNTHSLSIADGDSVDVQCVPSNTPAATPWAKWAATQITDLAEVWVDVANFHERRIDASRFPGGVARCLCTVWAPGDDVHPARITMQARLVSLLDTRDAEGKLEIDAEVGRSAEVTHAVPGDATFGVTLTGYKNHKLQVTSPTTETGLWCAPDAEVSA